MMEQQYEKERSDAGGSFTDPESLKFLLFSDQPDSCQPHPGKSLLCFLIFIINTAIREKRKARPKKDQKTINENITNRSSGVHILSSCICLPFLLEASNTEDKPGARPRQITFQDVQPGFALQP